MKNLIIALIILTIITFFVMKYLLINISFLCYLIIYIPIVILSIFARYYPIFSFSISLLVTIALLPIILSFNLFAIFKPQRLQLRNKVINFFFKTGILHFLSQIYVSLFFIPKKNFKVFMVIISIISIIYIITMRYYILHTYSTLTYSYNFGVNYTLVYIISIIGLSILYIRLLMSLSLNLTLFVLHLDKSLLAPSILLIIDPEPKSSNIPTPTLAPMSTAVSASPSTSRSRSPFFNFDFSRSQHSHHYTDAQHNALRFRNTSIGLACIGTAAACVGIWYAYTNSWEMTRQNDLEEVSQGFMSPEAYAKKYGKVLPASPTAKKE